MNELLAKALQGVDPAAPGAFWQIMQNLLALMPWWQLLWLNLLWVVVALAIAWWRGSSLGRAFGWAMVLGPVAWLIAWNLPSATVTCTRCGATIAPRRGRCQRCGKARPATPAEPAARAEPPHETL
ncbi:MAG TPA: hypothetical protein VFG73_07240 [Rhodanobacteraceae bacterium]|nr:hypothetical protein [Rhodanobacteraceae bacterium]